MTTPAQAVNGAACFTCISDEMKLPVLIYLLNKSGSNMTPQQLVTAAACYQCIPDSMQMSALIYVLSNSSSGGGNTALYGNGSPEGVVFGSRGQSYLDVQNHVTYWKISGDNTNTGWE